MNWERQLKRAFPDWEIVRGKKHIRLKHPSGAVHYASSTPSDHRTFMNLKVTFCTSEPLAPQPVLSIKAPCK
jgi:hypothetical protein